MDSKFKLIAIGNRFMKDDGIAIAVAEHLRGHIGAELDFIIAETDYQSCFYLINEDDIIIILDALYTDAVPGCVQQFNLCNEITNASSNYTQHDMSVIEYLKIHRMAVKGYLIGIEVAEIGYGDKLSSFISGRFNDICMEVEYIIKNILSEGIV
ncbi:MAG: hypothetical protein A2Y15_05290 [Clostridiales bacterium GWF2_36_10]|nr:MAG: hypothetical protein A2Y15_05290 [Clostridiales bacterium GWF2_36_10]HAN20078.1 hypothetical protein [Clostridiales bacterium]